MAQLLAVSTDWRDRELAYGQKLKNWSITSERFINVARPWLRYLGYLSNLTSLFRFARDWMSIAHGPRTSGDSVRSRVERARFYVTHFLRWYGRLGRPIEQLRVSDVDAYIAYGHDRGWCRRSIRSVVGALRMFLRYGVARGWCDAHLANDIHGPRIYNIEGLPIGPSWSDVQRLFSELDMNRPKDIRDKAILMLLTAYG